MFAAQTRRRGGFPRNRSAAQSPRNQRGWSIENLESRILLAGLSIWPEPDVTPFAVSDPLGVEVGVRFRSDEAGQVTALRFYKPASSRGGHWGALYSVDIDGEVIPITGPVTYTSETASGWQEVALASPVSLTAGSSYVVTYHVDAYEPFVLNAGYFRHVGADSGPLHADVQNGLFRYDVDAVFDPPSQSNYWADVVFKPATATLAVQSPAPDALGVPLSSTVAAQFTDTVASPVLTLVDATGASVVGNQSASGPDVIFTPASALLAGKRYTATLSWNAGARSASWSFTTAGTLSLLDQRIPRQSINQDEYADIHPYDLGLRFQASGPSAVEGVRFFRARGSAGPHIATLWSDAGTQLAQATFTAERPWGWQQVNFPAPVAIASNTAYRVSYHVPQGRYPFETGFFSDPLKTSANGVTLTALSSVDGGNGWLAFATAGNPVFPSVESERAINYWADVVLSSAANRWVDDAWTVTNDVAPAGLSIGDTVSSPSDPTVTGKIFGTDAFRSIAGAVAAAAAGDTITVLAGTYIESDIAVNKSLVIEGSAASRDEVRVVPASTSSPTGSLFAPGVHSAFILQSGNITFRNLTIDGGSGRNYRGGIVYDYRTGSVFNGIAVDNVVVQNVYDLGIYLDSGGSAESSGHAITNSRIDNVQGGTQATGILFLQASGSVVDNVISRASTGIGTNFIESSAYAPQVAIQGNSISLVDTGINLSGADEASIVSGNTIALTTGIYGLGIVVQYSAGQVTLEGNSISAVGADSAIWLFANTDPGKPVIVRNNMLSATGGIDANPGESTGIFLTDDGLLFSGPDSNTHALITGNTITGFTHGIDLTRYSTTGQTVHAIIGGTGAGEANTLAGNGIAGSTGIRIYDEPGVPRQIAFPSLILSGTSISGFETGIDVDGGVASISGSLRSPTSLHAEGSGQVELVDSQTWTAVTAEESARISLVVGGDKVLVTDNLALAASGTLDLFDNDLIIRSTSGGRNAVIDEVFHEIATAWNTAPPWQGPGLTSTAARDNPLTGLASIINDQGGSPIRSVVAGVPVGVNDILVKYTWDGDANLDGKIDAVDYFQIDSGYLAGLTQYRNGDFDYSGKVDAEDYFLIDSAYLGQNGILAGSQRGRLVVAEATTPLLKWSSPGTTNQLIDQSQLFASPAITRKFQADPSPFSRRPAADGTMLRRCDFPCLEPFDHDRRIAGRRTEPERTPLSRAVAGCSNTHATAAGPGAKGPAHPSRLLADRLLRCALPHDLPPAE